MEEREREEEDDNRHTVLLTTYCLLYLAGAVYHPPSSHSCLTSRRLWADVEARTVGRLRQVTGIKQEIKRSRDIPVAFMHVSVSISPLPCANVGVVGSE